MQSLKKETPDLPYSPLSAREVENNSIPDRCELTQALQVYTGKVTPSWTETLDRVNNYSKLPDPFGTCAARVTRASQSFSLVYATVVASSLVAAVLTALACVKSHYKKSQAASISSHTYVFTTPKKKRPLPSSNQKRPPLPKTSIKHQIISDFWIPKNARNLSTSSANDSSHLSSPRCKKRLQDSQSLDPVQQSARNAKNYILEQLMPTHFSVQDGTIEASLDWDDYAGGKNPGKCFYLKVSKKLQEGTISILAMYNNEQAVIDCTPLLVSMTYDLDLKETFPKTWEVFEDFANPTQLDAKSNKTPPAASQIIPCRRHIKVPSHQSIIIMVREVILDFLIDLVNNF